MSAGWGSFDRVMDVLGEALGQRPWILGERFSAADVMLGADLNYGVNIFKIVEPRPEFTAYIARCTARPAFQRASEIDKRHVGCRGGSEPPLPSWPGLRPAMT